VPRRGPIPLPGEENKTLAVVKILGFTLILLGAGVVLYWGAKSRAARARPLSGAGGIS